MKKLHKNKKGIAHLGLVVSIILIGAVGFAGWRVYDSQRDKNENSSEALESTVPQQSPQKYDLERIVSEAAKNVSGSIKFASEPKKINSRLVVKDEESGLNVNVASGVAYGIDNLNYSDSSAATIVDEDSLTIADKLEAYLLNNGFQLKSPEEIDAYKADGYYSPVAFYEDDKSYCEILSEPEQTSIQCTLMEDFDEQLKFIQPFYAAYGRSDSELITVEKNKIKTSGDYQNVTGGVRSVEEVNGTSQTGGGAAAIFYRKSGEQWKFFKATQSILSCSDFAAEVLQKALSDYSCLPKGGEKPTTVGEHFST